jgi:hypothetical protein
MGPLLSFSCMLDRTGGSPDAKIDQAMDAGERDAASDAGLDAFLRSDTGTADAGAPDAGFDACMPVAEDCNALDDDCDARVDEDGCAPCERRELESRVYLFCGGAFSWPDARRDCLDRGYDLVVIESMPEQDFVWREASAIDGTDWWIGLEDMESNGDYYWVDGTPCWVDGVPRDFQAFRDGRPDDNDSEACCEVDVDSAGLWADGDCAVSQPYVCETR